MAPQFGLTNRICCLQRERWGGEFLSGLGVGRLHTYFDRRIFAPVSGPELTLEG